MAVVCVLGAATASSASSPSFWKRCEAGAAAGQCKIPRGVATDPVSGHVYFADQSNQRVVEFTVWGEFVKAFGWGVKDGSAELQTCTVASTCRAGLSGSGPGQLASPQGLATDSAGNLYVVDFANHRVEKFDPSAGVGGEEAKFLLTFGGGVNQTSGGNLCPRPGFPADVCKAGSEGAADGQFGNWPVSSFIAVGESDAVFVGDQGRIQEFDSSGEFVRVLPDPEGRLAGQQVGSLAYDAKSKSLFFAYPNPEEVLYVNAKHDVFKLDPATGKVTATLEVGIPRALATGADGSVYVFDQRAGGNTAEPGNHISRLLRFPPTGPVEVIAQNESTSAENEFNTSTGIATGSACFSSGTGIYLSNSGEKSFVRAYGPAPDKVVLCPRPEVPPTITDTYAISVGSSDATLGAKINPHYWDDTTYRLQYGTGKCSEGGCTTEQPAPPGSLLESGIVEGDVTAPGIFVVGLSPATEYHYRFVAQSGGGGPTVGPERSFTTFPLPIGGPDLCANAAFRFGASAALADCRAYEMVSPVDKEGGDIFALDNFDLSSLSGEDFSYSSYRAFANPQSAPFSSQYLSHRGASGWQSSSISAPQEGQNLLPNVEGTQLFSLFKAFSPDLSVGWNTTYTEPVLAEGAQAGYPNLYRRDNSGGSYRACTATAPFWPEENGPQLQGVAADQQHAVWRIQNKLTAEASEAKNEGKPIFQLYGCGFAGSGGAAAVRLISALPNGKASTAENTLGTPPLEQSAASDNNDGSWTAGAVSADGARVFWTAFAGFLYTAGGPGPLYVRVNAGEEQSPVSGGKCTKALKACTYSLSASVGGEAARYWGATPSGSTALFTVEAGPAKGDLYLYGVDKQIAGEEPKTLVAHKTLGVLGTSEDLGTVYFLSSEAIGGEGSAGQPNLYRYEGGEAPATSFVATLGPRDAEVAGRAPSPVNQRPDRHTARVSPDGAHLAFMSSSTALAAATAGYDNTDLASGLPDAEVYRYAAGGDQLACLSCNRSGARPRGRQISPTSSAEVGLYAAAVLPSWETSNYASRALSEDGSRVYFESFEALVLTDTNGKADVYQWEQSGTGSCTATHPSYIPASGGCLSLISSGKSPADSEFLDASPSGADVFIRTIASLLPQDPGSYDVYDARALGGFPPPPPAQPECEGQACQNPAPAPSDPTPGSSSFTGPGNVKEPKPKSCPKGKHKVKKNGKVSCVKNHKKKSKSRASQSGRAGR